MNEELVKGLTELCGDDAPEDFVERMEKADVPKTEQSSLKKAVRVLCKYFGDFPDNLQKAIGVLTKAAGDGFVMPTGKKSTTVKLSDEDREQLSEISEALEGLEKKLEKSALSGTKGKKQRVTKKLKVVKKAKRSLDDDRISLTRKELDELIDSAVDNTLDDLGLLEKSADDSEDEEESLEDLEDEEAASEESEEEDEDEEEEVKT